MHQPSLHRLQRINDHRLYSNLCCQFRRVLPLPEARSAARGLAALIDGLWLRGALSGDSFDTQQAQQIAYEYMDLQLAKQTSPDTQTQASETPRQASRKPSGATAG